MTALAYDETPSAMSGQDGSALLTTSDGRVIAYVPHPVASLFPMIEGAEFQALVEDVRVNGVRRPIVMLDGQVLDGRNRYMAAREAGVGYPVVEFTGPDPVAFVISENLRRRHMSESQRASVGARLAKLPRGTNQHASIEAPSQAQAAELLNVSRASIQRAGDVHRHGTPALVAAVDAGQVTVSAAAEVAKLPETVQADIVAEGPEAVRETAKVIRDDATAYEKLKAGDPETVAEVRAQITEAIQNPAPRVPKAGRANPIHEPNPALDDALTVGDCSNQIADVVAKRGPSVLDAMPDAATRARAVAKVIRARDALNAILEERHGTH